MAGSAGLLIFLGPEAPAHAQAFLIVSLVWMILAPVLAGFTRGHARSVGPHVVAAVVFTVAIGLAFELTNRALPPGA